MPFNGRPRPNIRQHASLGERAEAAISCAINLGLSAPEVIDNMDDAVAHAYDAPYARLYVIDTEGRVTYQSGPVPIGFRPGEVDQVLHRLLGRT